MGTPEFAVPCLARLLEDGHRVALVITQQDKPKGRGYKLAPPPVKEFALSQGLEVFQPPILKTKGVYERLEAIQPDVIVVVAYGKILNQRILSIPRYGCINIHASLLPKYRGAAPIQWAILNGETETGVTSMQMDTGLDTGDMLLKVSIPIAPDMTGGELHDALAQLGARVLSDTLKGLEQGTLTPEKQDDAQSCYAPMLDKSLSEMDFSKSAQALHNQVRGLNPWPVAHCYYQQKRLRVFRTRAAGETCPQPGTVPGTVVSLSPFVIACGEGTCLELLEVQYEGGKRMPMQDFLRGHPIPLGAKIE